MASVIATAGLCLADSVTFQSDTLNGWSEIPFPEQDEVL